MCCSPTQAALGVTTPSLLPSFPGSHPSFSLATLLGIVCAGPCIQPLSLPLSPKCTGKLYFQSRKPEGFQFIAVASYIWATGQVAFPKAIACLSKGTETALPVTSQ